MAPTSKDKPTSKRSSKAAPASNGKAFKTKATAPSSTDSKKRVRVVEPASGDEDEQDSSDEEEKQVKGKGKTTKIDNSRKDLRDKAVGSVPKIVSKQVAPPKKGALKSTKEDDKIEFDEEEEDSEDESEYGDEAEEIDFLKGFESGEDDEDSSDEEAEGEFNEQDLPKVKGGKEAVQKKLEKSQKAKPKTGTVYLGRIPHGFHEAEMKSYFSQFGDVTRLRLSRNKKTGASKHYAFIEFAYESVAEIVQETMDNYLLSGHILVCKVVPNDQIHPKMWVGANRKFRPVPKGRKERVETSAVKTEKQQENIKKKLLKREGAKRKKLAELGIDYDFSGYEGKKIEGEKEDVKKAGAKTTKAADERPKKKARKST